MVNGAVELNIVVQHVCKKVDFPELAKTVKLVGILVENKLEYLRGG